MSPRARTLVSELVTVYSTVHKIGSKESKDVYMNIYNNVQYSTLNRVERVERTNSL